jgi:hypothetical protein
MSNKYVCARCGGKFEKGWSDEEAKAELDSTFAVPVEQCALVCDDCFRLLIADPRLRVGAMTKFRVLR